MDLKKMRDGSVREAFKEAGMMEFYRQGSRPYKVTKKDRKKDRREVKKTLRKEY